MKYIIKVIKESEEKDPTDPRERMGLSSREMWDTVLFQADMSSDMTIEILRHLYDLSTRKDVGGLEKKAE